ncbi:MAG: ferrochelatase [Acidobacteriota bacterium]|nr:ferrochelatase [Acidobacteriota bacterium]
MQFSEEPPGVSDPPPAGVLLVNLGSPEAATAGAVRTFLRQFLADPRVVELPRLRWWLIRNLFILPFRPLRSARAYRKIWGPEGSPLIATSRHQAADLEWELGKRIGRVLPVFAGMRYGKPSIEAALGVLRRRGCRRVLVLPLYPQYSATTTASTLDAVFEELTTWRCVPELRTVNDYHDHPGYIGALAASLQDLWHEDGKSSRVLLSFHGLPERYVAAGDPYEQQCRTTAALLSERLEIDPEKIDLGFQSRFGREPWIGLETAKLLKEAGLAGTTGLDVICPGFAADCLETLEEIAIAGRKIFTKAGGSGFRYVPALNRRPDHIGALAEIAIENMAGWLN